MPTAMRSVCSGGGAVMRIGADRNGRILEVLLVTRHGHRRIVDAMQARTKYLKREE